MASALDILEEQFTQGNICEIIDLFPVGVSIATDVTCEKVIHNSISAHFLRTKSRDLFSHSSKTPPSVRVLHKGRELTPKDMPIQRSAWFGETINGFELEFIWNDGISKWSLCSSRPIIDGTGKIIGALATGEDVTDRKKREKELHKYHERLESMVQSKTLELFKTSIDLENTYIRINETLDRTADGFFALDNDWRFVNVNALATKVAARKKDEMLGKSIWELFSDAQPYYDEYHKAKKENIPVFFEAKAVGNDRWLEVHAYPSEDGLSVFFRDITDRKFMEKKTRDYNELLREQVRLLNLDTDFILIRDLERRIIFWNQGAEQGYGWTKKEAIGKIAHVLLKTRYPQPLAKIENEVIAAGQWQGELIHTAKDGSLITVRSCWLLRKDADGNPNGIITLNRDITEETRIKEQMARLEQLNTVGQMAAGISHEIRNPITTVRGFLQRFLSNKDFKKHHEVINLMVD